MSEDETDGEETYEGELKDGERHGQGTWTTADGEKYVGEFVDGNKKAKSWWQKLTGKSWWQDLAD